MTEEVHVTRRFAAPRELVFGAFTDPEQVARWWAPEGFEVPRASVEIDAQAGGRIHFTMATVGGGPHYPVRFEILEIAVPELLVLGSPAMPEVDIAEPTLTRVEFDEDPEGTRVTITQGPHSERMAENATAGWGGSLDKLEAMLSAREPPSAPSSAP